MDITPAPAHELHLIQSYGAGRFVVKNEEIAENIIIWPTGVAAIGAEPELLAHMAQSVPFSHLSPQPELLIIGTGVKMQTISRQLRDHLRQHSIKHELMDTGAACRTYNVLASEDRRIAAYLMAV